MWLRIMGQAGTVQSNLLTAGFLTGSFVRMARNGKIQKEMCCVEPVAWS